MSMPLLIIGTGSQAKVALEIFQANQQIIYGFLSEEEGSEGGEFFGVPILGHISDQGILGLCPKEAHPFIALESAEEIKACLKGHPQILNHPMPNAIHPQAFLGEHLTLGKGNTLLPGAIIRTGSTMGNYNLIKENAIIGVEAQIGNYASIGESTIIGQGVQIGDHVSIGPQSIIMPHVTLKAEITIPPRSIITTTP